MWFPSKGRLREFSDPKADAIFLGGTGGYLQSLFKAALEQLNPQGRIVLNAVSIDTVTQMWDLIGQHPELEIEVIQAQIATAEPLGQTRIWKGQPRHYFYLREEVAHDHPMELAW